MGLAESIASKGFFVSGVETRARRTDNRWFLGGSIGV